LKTFTRHEIATATAIIFHAIGLAGILFCDKQLFASLTPYHLLLMSALLFYTQQKISLHFILFFIACTIIGFALEYAGTSTGLLFGNYSYGSMLGKKFKEVPIIIGLNWFIIIYCNSIAVHTIYRKLIGRLGITNAPVKKWMHNFSLIFDASLLAVIFDFTMEPAAVKLGFWVWHNGNIPMYNYVCWFLISFFLTAIFQLLAIDKHNKFAVHLLLIQLMFFLILRTFL